MLHITSKKRRPESSPFSVSISPSPGKKKKKKRREDEDEEMEDGEMGATQVDFFDGLNATQVDFHDEPDPHVSFKLTAFGDENIMSYIEEKTISQQWSEDEPYCVGRIKFLQLPEEHKNRISRKHFEIHCCIKEDSDTKEFWLVDCSANGTMVDGEVGHTGKKTQLEDGSKIGVLLSVAKDHILFGYSFSIGGDQPSKGNKKKDILKGKAIVDKTTTTTTKSTTKREGSEKVEVAGQKKDGVFAVPAPKLPAKSKASISIKPKPGGFMSGVRFSLVGYNEAALSDPKKTKLIAELISAGATYEMNPKPSTVDVIVLNRKYFNDPDSYEVNLPSLTSSLRIRFLSNTRWLEDCVKEGRKVEIRNEIFPVNSGGIIVLDKDSSGGKYGIDPRVVRQLASMLREEKKLVGAKWKLIAPLATLQACEGTLEGLEASVEVLKKGTMNNKGDDDMSFMLGIRELHAAGYRHTLLLVSSKDKGNVGWRKIENVASVVDVAGLTAFSQSLHAQRTAEGDKGEKRSCRI